MIGERLGHFQITAKLGEGGMGVVYRATDTTLDREVALKLLPEVVGQNPERLARFEREAKVLAALDHPNIAAIYGLEVVQGRHLLVMQLAEGETLQERIARGAIPLDETVPIALQIAEALEAAHERGVIHRDLKPANIKVTPEGQVKILDFGLAKALSPELASGETVDNSRSPTLTAAMTQAGVLLGTAAYMSPEQVKAKPADRRADVWAYGVVLWEMVTGRQLFEGETASEILAAVLRQSIDLDTLPSGTPMTLRALLARCLDRDPRSRLRDIGEARVALTIETESGRGSSLVTGIQHEAAAPRANDSRLAWLVAAAALAAALTMGLLWIRDRPVAGHDQELPHLVGSLLPPAGTTIVTDAGLALSADGQRLAFVIQHEDGRQEVCLQDLDESECDPLAGTEGARYPFWSPDGRHLGFFATGSLRRVDASGGPSRALATVSGPRGGTWCAGDQIVYAPRPTSHGLRVIPAAGGEPRELTTPDTARGETNHRLPFCMPSGEAVLMLAQTAEGGSREDESRIDWVSLATGERRAIVQVNSSVAYAGSGHLLYWQEGSLLAAPFDATTVEITGDPRPIGHEVAYTDNEYAVFSVSQTGLLVYARNDPSKTHSRLVRVDAAGAPLADPSPAGAHYRVAVSHDGTRAAYEAADFNSLWMRDLVRGATSRFTLEDGDHYAPIWSRDDEWILFGTDREGPWQIYRRSSSGIGADELLNESELSTRPFDVSPDDRWVSIGAREADGDLQITLLDLENGSLETLIDSPFAEWEGQFAPDGRWLAYVSNETGSAEVYILSLTGTVVKHQISTRGGTAPRWDPRGGRLFYVSADRALMAVAIDLEDPVRIGTPQTLFSILRPASGRAANAFADASPYAVLPDGKSFILNQLVESRIPDHITVVQNWLAELGDSG